MRKKILSLMLCLCLILSMSIFAFAASEVSGNSRDLVLLDDLSGDSQPAAAEEPAEAPLLSLDGDPQPVTEPETSPESAPTVPAIPSERQLPLVVDTAGVIDPVKLSALNERASMLSEKYAADVALIFVATTGNQSIQAFTDDFYDYTGYGYGESDSGIMLCIATQDRKFAISTYGPAAYTFSDYGQYYMDEAYLPYLKNSAWAEAGDAYLAVCEELMEYERVNGKPFDVDVEEPEDLLGGQILLSLIAGFILAFIPIGSMKRKMLNVQKQSDAGEYVQTGSFQLSRSHDRFLTRRTTRVPKPQPEDDVRSGGGGGTSFHTSSSGRSHGGHSGSF